MTELECLSLSTVESSKSIQLLHPHPSPTSSDSTKPTMKLSPRWTRSPPIMPRKEVPTKRGRPTLSHLQRRTWFQGRRRESQRLLVLMITSNTTGRSDQAPRTHGSLSMSHGKRSSQVDSGKMTRRRKKNLRRIGGCRRDRGSTLRTLLLHQKLRKKLIRRERRGKNRKKSRLLEGEPTRGGGVAVLAELGRERVLAAHLSLTQRVSLGSPSVDRS